MNNHDNILFFTERGTAFSLKAHAIPESARTALGTAITQVHRRDIAVSAICCLHASTMLTEACP